MICRASEFLARSTDPGSWDPDPEGIVATSRSRKGYELETCCPLLFPLTYIKGSMTECYIRAKDTCVSACQIASERDTHELIVPLEGFIFREIAHFDGNGERLERVDIRWISKGSRLD